MLQKIRLLTPGPTPIPETVRLAMARDMIHHRKGEFVDKMHQVQTQLRQLFGTEGPVLPLACSGTGAMTAAVFSLFAPGERVAVVEAGKFGERWREIAQSRGLDVVTLRVEEGKAIEPRRVLQVLECDAGIRGVLIQLCETSTAVDQPVHEIARLISDRNVLLVVDGISAVGISPCPMDDWGLDCLLTGSQKGLMVPPGLALIALSPRAWAIAEKMNPGCYYFDLPKERDILTRGQTHFTTPVSLLLGLSASLDYIMKESLPAIYKKQWAMTCLVRAGVQAMGVQLFAPANFAWGLTSILMPEHVDATKVLKIAEEKYAVQMAAGQGDLKNRIVRFGHMGWVDFGDCLAGLYALQRGIREAGGAVSDAGYLEAAMAAWEDAQTSQLPEV